MNDSKLPFQHEDGKIIEELLKNVSVVIKDSDAAEEKEIVHDFLRKVSNAITFVVVGNSSVGKSCFLNKLFKSALYDNEFEDSAKNIREYRYGAEEACLQADEYTTRIFRQKQELDGLQVVDTQGIDQMSQTGLLERVKSYIYKSSVLFAVYDARNVNDYEVWDLLEGVEAKKVIFILTKCDLTEAEIIEKNENRLRQYMGEAGLQAPVFRTSSKWEEEELFDKSGFEQIRQYIARQIIGPHPVLMKQQENLAELKEMLSHLSEAFECRKRQYEHDAIILRKIDSLMDDFVRNNRVHIDDLKESLRREILSEVDAYQNEIIAKLDPKKIKERFPNGSTDFMDYLNLINEGYRKRMTDNVNRRTQESVQDYLIGLEQVFERAVGYFNKRELLIDLENKFYGSMAESKKGMISRVTNNMEVTRDYYYTLTDASTELFMKLWKARSDRDRTVANAKAAGGVIGTAAGVGSGLAIAHVLGSAAISGAVAAAGTVLWPVVGAIVGAVLIAKIAKSIASANTFSELEKRTAEAVAEFKEEIAKTRVGMTARILDTVEKMFQQEVESVDRSFSEFRMSVNIDSKNIPALEEKLHVIKENMSQIEEMEKRRILEL